MDPKILRPTEEQWLEDKQRRTNEILAILRENHKSPHGFPGIGEAQLVLVLMEMLAKIDLLEKKANGAIKAVNNNAKATAELLGYELVIPPGFNDD